MKTSEVKWHQNQTVRISSQPQVYINGHIWDVVSSGLPLTRDQLSAEKYWCLLFKLPAVRYDAGGWVESW